MIRKFTNTYCDVCMSNNREVLGAHYGDVPVYFTDDGIIKSVNLDLCDECKSKITNLIGTMTYKGTVYSFKEPNQEQDD